MGDFPKKHGHRARVSLAVDQRLRDNAVALAQHFPCRAHGLGLKNEAGALLDRRSPGGALWKEAVLLVPPHKPGHSRTQLWTRRGGKPLPRLSRVPGRRSSCGYLGSGRGGPEGATQSRTGPRACLAKPCHLCQEGPLRPTEVCVRRMPVHDHAAVPAQARPGRGQSVWRTRREWRHVWCVHTRERLHTHTAVWSTGSHGNRAAAGEGASLPVPWERSPVHPKSSGTAVGLLHCRARSWSGSPSDTQTSGGRPAGAGTSRQGRVALRLKDGNQKRKADEIGMRGESWLPARRWRGAVHVQSHSGAWAGTQCGGQNVTNLTGGSSETTSPRPTNA